MRYYPLHRVKTTAALSAGAVTLDMQTSAEPPDWHVGCGLFHTCNPRSFRTNVAAEVPKELNEELLQSHLSHALSNAPTRTSHRLST